MWATKLFIDSNILSMLFLSVTLLSGCTTESLKKQRVQLPPGYARTPATEGVLAEMSEDIFTRQGSQYSGFRLLDSSYDGLTWRLALIDSAVSSLDILTYLWYPDNVGRLILEHAVRAAQRGVHVRMVVDDLLTMGNDQVFTELEAHPDIEFRLFNPWKERGNVGSRFAELLVEMERLNSRMHDKLIIADGNAIVIGGRNIGDHYFGLSHDYNFHDLDLLGFGHIARQANDMFDHFWNSEWVVSAQNLTNEPDPEFARQRWARIQQMNRSAEELKAFPIAPGDWSTELAGVAKELHIGTSFLGYDDATANKINQTMIDTMFSFLRQAKKEILITNAYFLPGQPAIDFLQEMTDRGIKVRVLTNSLASHDVPAVNSHYGELRDEIINAGVDLYEFRPDPQIRSLIEMPPVKGEFTGLHTKSAVVDRRHVFIGSMNYDPRSSNINTEMGAFIDSPGLGEELAKVMERDMQGVNSWHVLLDEKGSPYWVDNNETVYEQPARDTTQRIMDVIFKVIPREQN